MSKFILDFARNDSGAAAAEYVLILAIIGAGIGAGALYLGNTITTALSSSASKISNCSTGTTC